MTTNSFCTLYGKGQSLQEYGLIVGLVVIAAIPAVMLLGGQASQGIQTANQSTGQIKQLTSLLSTPATPGLVSTAPTLSPRIPLNGTPTRFRLNPATGKIEPVSDATDLDASDVSGNTTSAEGLVSQLLNDLENSIQGDLTPTQLANLNSIKDSARKLNGKYLAQTPPPPGTPGGGSTTSASSTATPMEETSSANTAAMTSGFEVAGSTEEELIKLNPSDTNTLTVIPPEVLKASLNFDSLTTSQQNLVNDYAYLQANVSLLLADPAFMQSNPTGAQQLTLLSNATLYNSLLPMLSVSPQQLVSEASTYAMDLSWVQSQLANPTLSNSLKNAQLVNAHKFTSVTRHN